MTKVFALVAAVALLTSSASAQVVRYHLTKECKFDMEQYCKGMGSKDVKKIKECLGKNEKNLLPRCQDHYKESLW